jgi:pyruvate kinase
MRRRTKIVCTLGPAVDSREKIKALIDAGMNVARLNCSHGDWERKAQWVQWIRELSDSVAPVAILVDLQGPKFRMGDLAGGMLDLRVGQTVSCGLGEGTDLPISQPEILNAMGVGGRLLLGDGNVELRLTDLTAGHCYQAKVVNGGAVKSRQGVTLVGKVFDVPSLTSKDVEDIQDAVRVGADFIALSYVKGPSDMRDLRRVVERLDPSIRLCAKIETRAALKEIDGIIKASDVIMVARGDLGLQMDMEDVPLAQKKIIERCAEAGTPVITATQMLESMIVNSRPTRAETTDVANAILDGTDAVMLSGETASGAYPIECVKTMVRIAERAETIYDRQRIEQNFESRAHNGVSHTDAVAHAVADLSNLLKPAAILCTTASGQTPRLVSKFRPKALILCACYSERVQRQMAIVWGVESITIRLPETTDETIACSIDGFLRQKRLKMGDHVIITAGVPAGTVGNTNLIMTQVVK